MRGVERAWGGPFSLWDEAPGVRREDCVHTTPAQPAEQVRGCSEPRFPVKFKGPPLSDRRLHFCPRTPL